MSECDSGVESNICMYPRVLVSKLETENAISDGKEHKGDCHGFSAEITYCGVTKI